MKNTKKGSKKPEDTLRDLLVNKIQALYDVETEITKALPKLIKAASDEELRQGFEEHLAETEGHVERLESIFEILDEKPKKLKVEAIRGLADDAEWVIKNVEGDAALDANLIAAAQYVEHYEMAGYGSAAAWAEELEEAEVAELLKETLEEEKAADEKLNTLATSSLNAKANVTGDDTEETKEGGSEATVLEIEEEE